ncbi:MAG: tRNA lysidine(34) synthetase TilS [Pseudobdellovibrionaceae bacterium]
MASHQTQWTPLEHQIYRQLKSLSIEKGACLLAVSGGVDSMALLQVFSRLGPSLSLQISVFHAHHGPSENQQFQYRNQALDFVRKQAEIHGFSFFGVQSLQQLHSENEMREFRKNEISKIQAQEKISWTVWAHHQDDFLETQILRLIRGAGKEAISEPMSLLRGTELRPFLQISRKTLEEELLSQKVPWLEDPSNQNENHLRNWLRNTWLPQLEQKCPGALNSFSRSLGLLQESFDLQFPEGIWLENGISRPLFLTLNEAQKRQCLALYLKKLGQMEFTHNQLQEVLKRLDNSQLNHTFQSAQVQWSFSKDLISAKSPLVVNAN